MSRIAFIVVIAALFSHGTLGASRMHSWVPGNDASVSDQLVAKFRSKYSDLKSVSFSFSSSSGKGTLRAVRDKGFRIEFPGTVIVSNGKVVWHVQARTKTVVINKVSEASDELGIERIFFALLHVYTPTVIKQSKSSSHILLKPPSAEATIAGVDKAVVELNSSFDVTRIEVFSGPSSTSWEITSLKKNGVIPTSVFTYKPPSGWTVVDLR